jgi:hypothetical protein
VWITMILCPLRPPAMVVLVKAMRVMLNRGMRIKFVLKDVRFILNAHLMFKKITHSLIQSN